MRVGEKENNNNRVCEDKGINHKRGDCNMQMRLMIEDKRLDSIESPQHPTTSMCHDLQQYSNMIMSQLTMQTVVFYSKTPGTWLWDDYKSACDLILTLNK